MTQHTYHLHMTYMIYILYMPVHTSSDRRIFAGIDPWNFLLRDAGMADVHSEIVQIVCQM